MIFDDLLDLGEIPTKREHFEEAERHNELRILRTPPSDPNELCLAGSPRSWWYVAFTKRLAKIEAANANEKTVGSGSKSSTAEGEAASATTEKTPKKSTTTTTAGNGPTADVTADPNSEENTHKRKAL